MSKEIIINVEKGQTRIALIEEGELAELYIENEENERTLGDIYLGRVRRTMPSIQAAFIDIGQKQDAFLHYSDLADNLPQWLKFLENGKPQVTRFVTSQKGQLARKPANNEDSIAEKDESDPKKNKLRSQDQAKTSERPDNGRSASKKERGGRGRRGKRDNTARDSNSPPPESFLDKGKRILVKIVKEPISAKGSRVSTDISLAGRFLVLVPLANYVAVSKKIYSFKERRRLRALARSLLPRGFGVIVRTVAEGKKAKELDTDLRLLLEKWKKIEKKLEGSPTPPVVVHVDANMASSVIRDLFSDDYDRILIDDPRLFKNVKNYVQAVAPHMVPAVQHHNGKHHIFKTAKIAHEINQAFESRVDLPSGGYLFIEHTEAMHVVDVNSGRAGRGLSQEENSLKVDIEAVHAIAKQIRLRDLGGIIVIDFIDLREDRNRKKVFYELRKAFRQDRAVTKILPMSDFGLVQITRQRLRPSVTKTFANSEGKTAVGNEGDRTATKKKTAARTMTIEGFVEKIERWITSYKKKGKGRALHLQVHPFAAAFLSQKIPGYPLRWFVKYLVRVKLKIDESLDPLGFRFVDPETGEDLSRRSPQRRGRGLRGTPKRNLGRNRPQERKSGSTSAREKSKTKRSSRDSSEKKRQQRSKRQPAQENRSQQAKTGRDQKPAKNKAGGERTQKESTDTKRSSKSNRSRSGSQKSNTRRREDQKDASARADNKAKKSTPKNSSQKRGSSRSKSQKSDSQKRDSKKNESQQRATQKSESVGDAASKGEAKRDSGQQQKSSSQKRNQRRNTRQNRGTSDDSKQAESGSESKKPDDQAKGGR